MTAGAAIEQREIRKVLLPGQTPEGQHVLSVIVKRTYDIAAGKACVRAERDAKIVPGDQFWDDPMNSSVKFEADFVPWKIATDIVLNGRAYAPAGRRTESFLAELEVGVARKQVWIVGDRVARYTGGAPQFTDPAPDSTGTKLLQGVRTYPVSLSRHPVHVLEFRGEHASVGTARLLRHRRRLLR